MKDKFSFYMYGDPIEKGQYQLSRSEKSYLFRRNFVRLLDIAVTVFWFLLLLSFPLGIAAGIYVADTEFGWPLLLFMLVIFLIATGFILFAWGKPFLKLLKMKWWISAKDVEVISVSGHLGSRIHATWHLDNFMSINNALIDFPQHWQNDLSKVSPKLNKAENPPECLTLRVAKVAKSSDSIIRFPMRHHVATRVDMVIGDFKYIVLQAGAYSIDDDYRNQVPVNRNHITLFRTGFEALIFGAILVVIYSVLADEKQHKVDSAKQKMTKAYAHIGIKNDIEQSQLANRDLPQMSYEADYGKRILSGEGLKYVTVSRKDAKKTPFILSRNEYILINNAASLSPNVSIGYVNKAKDEHIKNFRQRLIKQVNSYKNIPEPLKRRFTKKLQNMDKDLIARQLRSYGNGFVSDPLFVDALLPTPEIHPIMPKSQIPFCAGRGALCAVASSQVKLATMEHFNLTHANNRYQMSNYDALNYATESSQYYENVKSAKQNLWLLLITGITLGGGICLQFLYWLARFKTKRTYARLFT